MADRSMRRHKIININNYVEKKRAYIDKKYAYYYYHSNTTNINIVYHIPLNTNSSTKYYYYYDRSATKLLPATYIYYAIHKINK